ncbi:MAG: glycoside hydrolase family 15 protein [Paracoccus sp. (in: a-proteobacteria)]|uniref:glycoside hydrolase family 15 protein n=1 Tax=Paracoccus sp. TaxID=267 RepID=UPI004058064C
MTHDASRDDMAPGAPGISPTWASSDKDFVTSGLGIGRVWATVGHGVLNEVYWPSTGQPRIRDLTFYLVAEDEGGTWIDLKRECRYQLQRTDPACPLSTVIHEGETAGIPYRLELEFLPDTDRDALFIRYAVTGPWTLVAIMAPRLDGEGVDMTAWTQDGALMAAGPSTSPTICLRAHDGFARTSVGFAGTSDGWQDLDRHGRITWSHTRAEHGNVALTGVLPAPEGVLVLAFGESPTAAQTLARSAHATRYEEGRDRFRAQWASWNAALAGFDAGPPLKAGDDVSQELIDRIREAALLSATVLKAHEDRSYPGALVASLSTPWGSSTNTLGGYHLVWPRDTVLTAFAFIALGLPDDAVRILGHLVATQCADGHWTQNAYPSGAPFWTGIQLDEAGFPILLAAKMHESGIALPHGTPEMVRRAVAFIARTGPSSQQDRWEENPGINPFTLSVAIAALVAAEPWLDADTAAEALDLADDWCARIEDWCWVDRSRWTDARGATGHYIRIAPDGGGKTGQVRLGNRNGETIAAADLVAMEFSYLTRLGLRAPDDPRMIQTLKVVDHVLASETPSGRVYHRYNQDGYGEYADGAPYNGAGIGRGWPFLVGERGHLALDLGASADPFLATMLACASIGGLMPEQVWDSDPIPGRGLYPGRPSGSAMPLLWTHAEFIKLLIARREGKPVERLACVATRYAAPRPPRASRWRDSAPLAALPDGSDLVIEDANPFSLHFGLDGWDAPQDRAAETGPFGLWRVYLKATELAGHKALVFTRDRGAAWEGADHHVSLEGEN